MRFLGIVFFCSTASAQQATFKGQVLADSTERPIPGATVTIELLKLSATSDSLGEFTIHGITPGAHLVSARRIGFGPLTTRITFMTGAVVEADLMMVPTAAQALPDVTVNTKAIPRGKLAEFETRRQEGHGRFITRDILESRPWSRTADVLRSHMPGMTIIQNSTRPSEAYVAAGRMSVPGGALSSGSKPGPCFAAVVLDGIFVFVGDPGSPNANGSLSRPQPNFDINSVPANSIAGVEYYAGPATVPVKYSGMRNTCGLIIVWTK